MKFYYRLGSGLVLAVGLLLIASVASAQPPIPHPREGRDDCLSCHQAGVGGAPRVASDHVGRTNESCGQCHVPVGVGSAAVPAIPHAVEGRETCLTCHETGVGGATKFPDDHAGRANQSCPQCHAVAGDASSPTAPGSLALPLIPHLVEGREACLTCHEAGAGGATAVPDDHAGRTNDACQQCHRAAHVTPIPVPGIPHSVDGREACLACHAGWIGQAPLVPDDHAGRSNEICQWCHQQPVQIVVTPTPKPIPTAIVHPVSRSKNSCLECHRTLGDQQADITRQWEGSYFAAAGVSCADCHGGDPQEDDATAAMSPDAGFIGTPDRTDIPALCGSCHANPEKMRPYELPMDQLREYENSVHGQRLAQGDENVPTCFDCHGGHATLKTDDPRSSVYPTNLPATCASCHADEERMEPYGIPTNQYELYRKSVHGVGLLEEHNLEAPSCPTCHGSHGATLPGYDEVVDVCGTCHASSEKYYLLGGHRLGQMTDSEAPRCTTCHGRYDVQPASVELYVGDEPRQCGSCHPPGSVESAAIDVMYQTLVRAERSYQAAEKALVEAQAKGLSLTALQAQLTLAETRLAEAKLAQHEVRLATIEEKTSQVESISVEVQEALEKAVVNTEWQRLLPGGIAGLVLVLGGVVAILLRRRAKVG